MELSKYERLVLFNQYEILQRLSKLQGKEHEVIEYANKAKVVSEGFVKEYDELEYWDWTELSVEDCNFVWDVLTVYSYIKDSYVKLTGTGLTENDIKFCGFDGNNECLYRAYCLYIIKRKERFINLINTEHADFNSHMPTLDMYSRMLDKWQNMGKPYDLTEAQIKTLLNKQ